MQTAEMHQVATRFYPRIQRIARGIARNLPAHVDVEDLTQAGVIGMMSALKAYDPARGEIVEVYLTRRVRGAILDELRALDPLSRDQRRDAREVTRVTRVLEGALGRAPEDAEIAASSGISVERMDEVRERSNAITPMSLDADGFDFADGRAPTAHELVEIAETQEQLTAAIEGLPDRQRLVLSLYYLDELSLKEIGQVLGVTESRVCQIHGAAVAKLRETLADA